ncbi:MULTISPECIES: MFS transporter [unclassified Sphingobium]|uniref:MFS transporter n=1 Tax=unclassified Sphingobium TaxID=2611147 RepID=UPI002223FBEC|nr:MULTISPECIES: MFS transporter [unclassified Sphingobium]MCW2381143.1 MFS family permease [Sphingobium sp. B2D3B]MCW2398750.1 MFS family permease [Sphingobium sp. B2D3C]MCW2411427.1 MFS family permease [Sphingobium sp. B8D3D]MCW2416280.1 MFS family permease [Sphingobium sp. B8D3A]
MKADLFSWYRGADRKTRRVFWTCSAGWAMDSADGLVYQYLIPLLIVGLGISLTEAGTIASANYFAAAIGGWIGGWLCDRYGRARILQLTILWFSFFSFASGFAQNFEQLLVLRVLQGIGFGAEWAVGAVLLGEIVSPKHRGKALGTLHSGAAVGSGLAALIAGPFASAFDPEIGWRLAFFVGIIPAALIFFIRRGSDDSDLFKQAQKRAHETGQRTSLTSIFRPKVVRITVLASLLAVGAQGAGYAVSSYLTVFLANERGIGIAMAGLCVMFNSVGGFFGFLFNAAISDFVGRRNAFRLFGLGFVISAAIYLFGPWGGNVWFLVPFGIVYGFFQFGIYASFGPYFTELFPTELRGTGQAFAYNFGRAASALFIMTVPLVAAIIPLGAAMAIVGMGGILCALIATLMLPETAGRALQSLDDFGRDEAPQPIEAKATAP